MQRKKITIDCKGYPEEVASFLKGADTFDSSCSEEARVYYIDKKPGYFLKEAEAGTLKAEYLMHDYFHKIGLTSRVVLYRPETEKDYLITELVSGYDCTHKMYIDEPERLCDTIASVLRKLHDMPIDGCPITNRTDSYVRSVLNGYASGNYEADLFEGLWEFKSDQDAWSYAREGMSLLETDTLIHGDYCLPNIMLDDWNLSGFIDLVNGGVCDRHIDILWGIWTLKYNLGTDRYSDRFIDAYGRELVDEHKLRCIAAMEIFGG